MSKVSVFENEWIDLVFEGRNQKYGAYQLRKQDSRTTMLALFSGIALVGLAIGIPAAISQFSDKQTAATDTPALPPSVLIELDDKVFIEPPKPIEKPEPIIKKPAAAAPPAADVTRFKPIIASTTPDPELPTIEKLKTSNPGSEDVKGNPSQGSVLNTSGSGTPGGEGDTPSTTAGTGEDVVISAMLDVSPEYPGGMAKFYEEVGRSYRIPEVDMEMTVKVYVSFVIEKDGSMTNIKVVRDPNQSLGLGKEALRVLQKMKTKWKPGKMKGQPVRTAYNLPITVNIK